MTWNLNDSKQNSWKTGYKNEKGMAVISKMGLEIYSGWNKNKDFYKIAD